MEFSFGGACPPMLRSHVVSRGPYLGPGSLAQVGPGCILGIRPGFRDIGVIRKLFFSKKDKGFRLI